jgi:uncharacterized protein (DUF3820 family)
MKELGDSDSITFGTHKGKKLEFVPAHYLLWLLEQEWLEEKYPELFEYISNREQQLEDEKSGR